jgi:hypothetical protein
MCELDLAPLVSGNAQENEREATGFIVYPPALLET